MSNRVERARELFLEGYNCSQAVVGAFCEEIGLDFSTAMRLSSSFGGGMGRLREVCGAVSGIFIIAGLKYGCDTPGDNEKKEHYRLIQSIAKRFKDRHQSIVCRELLKIQKGEKATFVPAERTAEYYKKRPCLLIVEEAVLIAEEVVSGEIFNHLI